MVCFFQLNGHLIILFIQAHGANPEWPARDTIGFSALLAVCSKTFMEHHSTMNLVLLERQCEKVLWWNAVNNQVRETSKAKPFIVARISHQYAAFCTQCL